MNHCYHASDRTMMSNPPQNDYKCCHCGKVYRVRAIHHVNGGHGPHVQMREVTVWPDPPVGECSTNDAAGDGK